MSPANSNMGWGPNPGQQSVPNGGQQQLSVVATVWGVTTSTQSGPMSHNYPGANGGHPHGAMGNTYSTSAAHPPSGYGNAPGMGPSAHKYGAMAATGRQSGPESYGRYVPCLLTYSSRLRLKPRVCDALIYGAKLVPLAYSTHTCYCQSSWCCCATKVCSLVKKQALGRERLLGLQAPVD